MSHRSYALILFFALSLGILSFVSPDELFAQSKDEIEAKIEDHNQKIQNLEKEIATYQKQLNVLGVQKNTLQSAIKTLDVSRQQTSTQISVTQNKIAATNLKLQELSGAISQKEYTIALDKQTVGASLREIAERDESSLIEQLLSTETFGQAWLAVDDRVTLSNALREHAAALAKDKEELALKKNEEDTKKVELTVQKTDLTTQKKTLDVQKAEKDKLLTQTKNQESSYQSLIETKKAQQKAFQAELTALEASLKSVSASAIPTVGSGILVWPYSATFKASCDGKASALGNAYCVTQYFGNTAFAQSGAYNGSGHNGIDIGMPIGTPVLSALSGTVLATGNTDLARSASGAQCYSFGKWVMVKHANGLSTMYAHLSSINVSPGQAVATGEVIGNSGITGYATGPHLHFSVYASAGVQITTLNAYRGSTTPCANASMPVAPLNAYLNPMSYL